MNNYRIEFLFGQGLNKFQAESYDNFSKLVEKYYPLVRHIRQIAKDADIPFIWAFYEPHVEITWISDRGPKSELLFEAIEEYLRSQGIFDYRRKYPKDGDFADWYGKTKEENEFGAEVHDLCSNFVDIYHDYQYAVDNGKGLRKQVERTIHRLCNPLGLTYKEEAKICFSRGLICLLFTIFSFERAVWIYRNIFRQTY